MATNVGFGLIPAGSRLLELAEVREMVLPFDPAALSYPWRHEDPALAHDRPVPVDFHLAARATIPYLDEPWYC